MKKLTILVASLLFSLSAATAQSSGQGGNKANTGAGSTSGTTSGGGTTGGAGTMDSATKDTRGKSAAMSQADRTFLMNAANAGKYEIEAANLAMEKASDNEVKEYARMMLEDHKKASKELSSIMSSKGIKEPEAVTGEEKTMLEDLKKANGKEFDKMYKKQMVTSHKKAVKMHEDAANTAKDSDIKNHASSKLPKLKHHLDHAQKMDGAAKSSK